MMPCSLLRRPRCAPAALAMFSTAPTPCSTKLDAASICNGDDPTLQRPTPEPPPTLTPCSRPTLSTKHDFARYTISRDPVNSYLPVVVARPAAKAILPMCEYAPSPFSEFWTRLTVRLDLCARLFSMPTALALPCMLMPSLGLSAIRDMRSGMKIDCPVPPLLYWR